MRPGTAPADPPGPRTARKKKDVHCCRTYEHYVGALHETMLPSTSESPPCMLSVPLSFFLLFKIADARSSLIPSRCRYAPGNIITRSVLSYHAFLQTRRSALSLSPSLSLSHFIVSMKCPDITLHILACLYLSLPFSIIVRLSQLVSKECSACT